ncbi:MAG TPA: LysE family transporter [Bacillota bacterium]
MGLRGAEIFFLACGVALSGALMPGPLLTINIRESLKTGFWAGPKLILGHALLEAMLVLALLFGLGSIIELPLSKGIISILGGMFLFWMAYGMLFKEGKDGLSLRADQEPSPTENTQRMSLVLTGALISLANPYWSLWWATLGLGFLTQAREFGFSGIVFFYSGHIFADFLWYSLISLAVSKGKTYLSPKLYRGIIIVCAIFLLYLSFDFFWHTVKIMGLQ